MLMRTDVPMNALSVDVEDYFQVSAFERHIRRDDWARLPARVERNTERVLALLERHATHATFFTLGWVAERYPELIRRIVAGGHELASHGMFHVRVTRQSRDAFRADAGRSRKLLEDLSGTTVRGYRAASFSIGRDNLWAHEILAELGYEYSSSIFPVRHDLYGMREAPRFAFRPRANGILEVPLTTTVVGGHHLPCGGGGYFRLFPYAYFRWALGRVNRGDGQPAVFYFHPWELDPDQPRQQGIDLKTRFRHYNNLKRMEARLDRLLDDFRWERLDTVFLAGTPGASYPVVDLVERGRGGRAV